MHRSGLGKVAGLLPLLFYISWGVVSFVPHSSPFFLSTAIASLLLTLLAALYWFATGLKQGREQHRAWYKQVGVLVSLGYLLALLLLGLHAAAPANTLNFTSEVVLFLLIALLFGVARWKSGPGPAQSRRESVFSRKAPPTR